MAAVENIYDVTCMLINSARKGMSQQNLERVFQVAVAWYSANRPGASDLRRACALGVNTEINEHCFDSLGQPRHYWVRNEKGKMYLMKCSDVLSLLGRSYPSIGLVTGFVGSKTK